MNNIAGIMKKNQPIIPSLIQWPLMMIPIYSHFNHCHNHMFISHMRAIKEINMKMLNDMWDTHMVWIENDTIDIIFIFISFQWPSEIICIFNSKEFHWNRCSIPVALMANNMYFIQWIMTSYYQKGYKLYRNYSMWIKIACIQSCSQILSRFN